MGSLGQVGANLAFGRRMCCPTWTHIIWWVGVERHLLLLHRGRGYWVGLSVLMTCLRLLWWHSSHMGSTVQCGPCVRGALVAC